MSGSLATYTERVLSLGFVGRRPGAGFWSAFPPHGLGGRVFGSGQALWEHREPRKTRKPLKRHFFFFLESFQLLLLNCLNHVTRQIYAFLFCDP